MMRPKVRFTAVNHSGWPLSQSDQERQNAPRRLANAVKPYHSQDGFNEELAMEFARSALAVLLFGSALCAGAASAQAQTFNFQVCNHSNVSASVAISHHVDVGDSRYEVAGWWTVAAGNCESIGNFPQGWFYFYAEQTNSGAVAWTGNFALCIEYPGPFDRINTAGFTCPANELKQFVEEEIPSTTGTFTWNLN